MNGKGSRPRKLSVSREEFARRWDEAFGKTRRYIAVDPGVEQTVSQIIQVAPDGQIVAVEDFKEP